MDENHQATGVSATEREDDDRIANEVDVGCRDVQAFWKHSVLQLSRGCLNKDCSEVLCHTGRTNRSQRPVRRYNGRSAKLIATVMCSHPERSQHLCQYLPEGISKTEVRRLPDTARDPSSLPQLLADTKAIDGVLFSPPSVRLDPELVRRHEDVSRMLRSAGRIPPLDGKDYLSNAQLVDGLFTCFVWLLSKLPMQRMSLWVMVNRDIISKGYSYPSKRENMPVDSQYNMWLTILDILDHQPYLHLLERMMLTISQRRTLEERLYALDQENGDRLIKIESSVEYQLAHRLYSWKKSTEVLAAIVWLKKLFTKVWDSQPTVKYNSVCFGVLQTMSSLLDCPHAAVFHDRNKETFRMPMIGTRVTALELASSFMDLKPARDGKNILAWPFLFSQDELSMSFRTINHFVMRQATSDVEKSVALRRRMDISQYVSERDVPEQLQHAEKHYLLLTVSRRYALSNTFNQLWQRRRDELRRPLRVRLGETDQLELGHDLGGVQMEFFNLVCKQAFAEETGLFTTDSTTGCSYVRPGSLQPLHMFEMLGVLLALALYNGITLPICLPRVFYTFLAKPPQDIGKLNLTPEDIQDMSPVVAKSLQQVIDEDVSGLEFAYALEANGLSLTVVEAARMPWKKHGYCMKITDATPTDFNGNPKVDITSIRNSWPGWEIVEAEPHRVVEEVTAENKTTYVTNYVEFLSYRSVAPQIDALLQGFHSADLFDESGALSLFTADQLKAHLEGLRTFDINELKESAKYDGYDGRSKYIQSFWRIVATWPETKQRQLLKFVTAAERIPITGAKHLTFIVKKVMPESMESLPTSSTCFGTLMLPRYQSVEVMARKLGLALEYGSEGFGTG